MMLNLDDLNSFLSSTCFKILSLLKKKIKISTEMDPVRYLEKHCKVNDRRKALYRRVFDRYKLKADGEEYVDMKVCHL